MPSVESEQDEEVDIVHGLKQIGKLTKNIMLGTASDEAHGYRFPQLNTESSSYSSLPVYGKSGKILKPKGCISLKLQKGCISNLVVLVYLPLFSRSTLP